MSPIAYFSLYVKDLEGEGVGVRVWVWGCEFTIEFDSRADPYDMFRLYQKSNHQVWLEPFTTIIKNEQYKNEQ